METGVECPRCGRSFRVPPELVGKRMRCLQCQNVFTVEVATAEPAEPVTALQSSAARPAVAAPVARLPEEERPPRRKPPLKRADHGVPGYLWPLAALPWLLLPLALVGCVWGLVAGMLAAGLSAAGVVLVRARQLSVGVRLAGLLAIDGAVCLAGLVAVAVLLLASALPTDKAAPLDKGAKYLADMDAFGVRSGPWPFSHDGTLGDPKKTPIVVNGVRSSKGLGMHPPWAPGYATARYRLDRQAGVFRATAAVNDTTNWCWSPAIFTVLGDGKELWKSDAISFDKIRSQECQVSVKGVEVLELRVQAFNGSDGLHAVWVEPRLLEAAELPGPGKPRTLFAAGPRVYLSDLEETAVRAGPWPFSNNGVIGPDRHPIKVNGVPSPKGLGLHPPDSPGDAAVSYRLGRQAAVFKAAVALNDTCAFTFSQAVFEVSGDGKRLWQSAPVGKDTPAQECRVDVSGVDVLELRVASQGSHFGLHAVWVEPRLLQKADTPDR
jgi:hypothetical protein